MRCLLVLAGSLALAGCAAAPRDIALAGLDLSSPAVIAQVSEGLPQKQRAALATFALLHWPESKAYCGRPVFKGAGQPNTVGEAIDKTIEFETALMRKRIEEKMPPSIFEQQTQYRRQLIDEFDQLTLERDMLTSRAMPAAEKESRIQEINRKLAENRETRDRLTETLALPTASTGIER